MANTELSIQMITNRALEILENQCVMPGLIQNKYSDQFGIEGAKIGSTVQVRKPARVIAGNGQELAMRNFKETSVPVSLTTQTNIGMSFSSAELLLNISDFGTRVIAPQIAQIANVVDSGLCNLYKQVYNSVGTPGTPITTLQPYLNAGVKLDNNACPQDGMRRMVLDPQSQADVVYGAQAVFNPQSVISKQYSDGKMYRAVNFDWDMDQNIKKHRSGVQGGSPVLASAVTEGATSLSISGATASVTAWIRQGDVMSFGSGSTLAYMVNPQNYEATGVFQCVAAADAASDSGGLVTIQLTQPIYGPGTADQTIDALPGAAVVLNIVGASNVLAPVNMAFHRDAFAFVSAELPLPPNTKAARQNSKKTGLSLRIIGDYSIIPDLMIYRVDILWGCAAIRPELACRIPTAVSTS